MGKRFGRNQKRAQRARIAELELWNKNQNNTINTFASENFRLINRILLLEDILKDIEESLGATNGHFPIKELPHPYDPKTVSILGPMHTSALWERHVGHLHHYAEEQLLEIKALTADDSMRRSVTFVAVMPTGEPSIKITREAFLKMRADVLVKRIQEGLKPLILTEIEKFRKQNLDIF